MGLLGGGTTTTTTTTPHQQQQFNRLLGGADIQAEKGFFDPSVYEQSGVVGFTPEQQQALAAQKDLLQSTGSISTQALGGIRQMLSGEVNPIYEQQAKRAADFLGQQFERSVPREIGGGFQGAGQFGSTRHGIAEGLARSDLQRQTGDVVSDIFSRGAQEASGRQQFALGNLGALLGQASSPASQLFNIGATQQQQQQLELSDLVNRRLALQQLPLAELQAYKGLISGDMGGTTVQTQEQEGGMGALAGIGLDLVGSAFGIPGMGTMLGGLTGQAGGAIGSGIGAAGSFLGGLF